MRVRRPVERIGGGLMSGSRGEVRISWERWWGDLVGRGESTEGEASRRSNGRIGNWQLGIELTNVIGQNRESRNGSRHGD